MPSQPAPDKSPKRDLTTDPANWVEQHGDYLYRYAYHRLRDQTLAEDMVQETFLAALDNIGSFAGKSTERTWFVAILKNKIVDHIRKASREVNFDVDHSPRDSQEDDFHATGPQAGMWKSQRRPGNLMIDHTDVAERNEFWQYLLRCLDDIDQRHSLAFVLREMEEMPSEEICNVLRLKSSNLRVILYRARKLLRRCLENNWLQSHRSE